MFKKKSRPTATRKHVDNVDDDQHPIDIGDNDNDNNNVNNTQHDSQLPSNNSKSPALR